MLNLLVEVTHKQTNDEGVVARNRGFATEDKGNETLQILCKSQYLYLKKPEDKRLGTSLLYNKGNLSEDALKHFLMDM